MNMKAEMGAYSSVVGNSVHLIADDGRMIGQVAILCHTDDLRNKQKQEGICRVICDAINSDQNAVTDDLQSALRALNNAAYAAIRAGKDTTEYPDLNRQALRRICKETDTLVDTEGREA